MPLVDLDDPVELRARWAALAAVAHAAGRDRIWWADERGLHYEDPRGNDLRLIVIADGRAVLFGYHDSESRTADADLLSGSPDWIGQPEVRHRIATGGLGFVYGHFAGTWARAEYPGDPWQPLEDGFAALGSWLTDDRETEYEIAEQVLSWVGAAGRVDPQELRFGAMTLIQAAATSGIDTRVLGDFFALLRGAEQRLRPDGGPPDLRAGLAAAILFGGPTASRSAADQPVVDQSVADQSFGGPSPYAGESPFAGQFVGESPFAAPSVIQPVDAVLSDEPETVEPDEDETGFFELFDFDDEDPSEEDFSSEEPLLEAGYDEEPILEETAEFDPFAEERAAAQSQADDLVPDDEDEEPLDFRGPSPFARQPYEDTPPDPTPHPPVRPAHPVAPTPDPARLWALPTPEEDEPQPTTPTGRPDANGRPAAADQPSLDTWADQPATANDQFAADADRSADAVVDAAAERLGDRASSRRLTDTGIQRIAELRAATEQAQQTPLTANPDSSPRPDQPDLPRQEPPGDDQPDGPRADDRSNLTAGDDRSRGVMDDADGGLVERASNFASRQSSAAGQVDESAEVAPERPAGDPRPESPDPGAGRARRARRVAPDDPGPGGPNGHGPRPAVDGPGAVDGPSAVDVPGVVGGPDVVDGAGAGAGQRLGGRGSDGPGLADGPGLSGVPDELAEAGEFVGVPGLVVVPEPARPDVRDPASYETLEEAMRAEPERPRPRPEPGPAFKTLHEWCRERTKLVPSGFTIHVYVANPQAIGYSYDLEPPEVPGSRLAADRIGSLLHALWQEETDARHGAWMFARIDAAGRTLRIDRWYDSVPAWWEGPIADRAIDESDVGWHLEHRSDDWQPSYASRLELAAHG